MNLTYSQKKAVGVAIIIIFGAIDLIFLAVLIFTLINGESSVEQAISFLFVMGIFAVPLWWGIRLRRASVIAISLNRPREPLVPVVGDASSVVSVQTKIELSEYRRMVFYNTYSHPLFIFLHFIGISFILFYLVGGAGDWFVLFTTIFLLYLPISIYRSSRSSYESSKTVHEHLFYTFSPQGVEVRGETVNFSIQWRSLFKIRETRSWFLLYTNKQSAMLIPKSSFTSEEDVTRLRAIIPMEVVREGINII
jgi:hypothetical protein